MLQFVTFLSHTCGVHTFIVKIYTYQLPVIFTNWKEKKSFFPNHFSFGCKMFLLISESAANHQFKMVHSSIKSNSIWSFNLGSTFRSRTNNPNHSLILICFFSVVIKNQLNLICVNDWSDLQKLSFRIEDPKFWIKLWKIESTTPTYTNLIELIFCLDTQKNILKLINSWVICVRPKSELNMLSYIFDNHSITL